MTFNWDVLPKTLNSSIRPFLTICLVCVVLLAFSFVSAQAAQVNLSWTANIEPDVIGYKIYYGEASGRYTSVVNAGNTTAYTVSSLLNGKSYYFAVTGYRSSGVESDFSQEVACTTPAPACSYSVSPTSQSYPAIGGDGTITVTTSSGCTWSASSNSSWITVDSGSTGSGNGSVHFVVSANTGTGSRGGTVTVAGTSVSIMQAGVSNYTISASAGPGGVISPSGRVTVGAGSSRAFTVTPNARYAIRDVAVDGVSVGAISSYNFTNVNANHTIRARFSRK